MRKFALLLLLVAVPAFADYSGGVVNWTLAAGESVDAGSVEVPFEAAPAPLEAQAVPTPPSLDTPTVYIGIIFRAVKTGNWWMAAAAFLVLLVSLLRVYGKRLHEWLPDNQIWDKPLWFLFDTKPGGWLLNLMTAVAGGCGTSLLAGEPVTWSIVKPILMVSVTASALWELVKDIIAWVKSKAKPAPVTIVPSLTDTPKP